MDGLYGAWIGWTDVGSPSLSESIRTQYKDKYLNAVNRQAENQMEDEYEQQMEPQTLQWKAMSNVLAWQYEIGEREFSPIETKQHIRCEYCGTRWHETDKGFCASCGAP